MKHHVKLGLVFWWILAGAPFQAWGDEPTFTAEEVESAEPLVSDTDEMWKGNPYEEKFSIGLLGGLGSLGGTNGFSLLASASIKILHKGFLDDVNDQVHLEAQVGPYFRSGGSNVFYSGHMRWDFHQNYQWTFFALGGLAGTSGTSGFGNVIHLRFAVGAFWHLFSGFSFRFEAGRELIGAGISIML